MAVAMTGARTIGATREAVWAALNDVDCLRLCVPGCQDLRHGPGRTYRLKVRVRLGPVLAAFSGSVEVTHSDFPHSFVMSGRGDGGLAGFAKGTARIRLAEVPGGCRLSYSLETSENGPLEALGVLFLSGIAKSLSDRFVGTLADLVGNVKTGAGIREDRRAP